MCDPVSLGLMAASVIGKTINTRQTFRRKDREIARGIREKGKIGRESAARTEGEIQNLAKSDPEAERAESLASFVDALREGKEETIPGVEGANQRFAEDVAAARSGVAGDASTRAGLLSRIDAPVEQRRGEAVKRGRLASDTRMFADRGASAEFLAQLRASEQRNNPFVDAIASIAGGVASAGVAGGGANLTDKLKGLFSGGEEATLFGPL
ncbi:hypothetical protein LCGC14_2005320 [marine sediment metagenome]|uniref:Uncharacterized protein n=1 Tax=marine sediment metagenome TaxID=412755 RepID=A0A0F9HFD0_9ZZZZ